MALKIFKKSDKDEKGSGSEKKPVSTLQPREDQADQNTDKKAVEKAGVVAASKKKYPTKDHAILVRPIVTEKSFRLNTGNNQYVFEVQKDANKVEIKKAFFNVYGVMPLAVNVSRGGGDAVKFGRSRGTSKTWKRAIITIKKGEKIEETV